MLNVDSSSQLSSTRLILTPPRSPVAERPANALTQRRGQHCH